MNRVYSPSSVVFAVSMLALTIGCTGIQPNHVQGSGVAQSEIREVGDFERISVLGSADVTVSIGPEQRVTVEADDNILPLIETDVDGDTLEIGSRQAYSSKLGVKITIVTPTLSGVAIKGSGDVDVTGLRSESFNVAISGSGNVKARGEVQQVNVAVHGSGDVRLRELQTRAATISIAGSGDVFINASDKLKVSIAGSGDVQYSGDPEVQMSIGGSGSLRRSAGRG